MQYKLCLHSQHGVLRMIRYLQCTTPQMFEQHSIVLSVKPEGAPESLEELTATHAPNTLSPWIRRLQSCHHCLEGK